METQVQENGKLGPTTTTSRGPAVKKVTGIQLRLLLCRLQLRALKLAIDELAATEDRQPSLKLVLIGGCRDQGDADRAAALQALAEELGISQYVQLIRNAPFSDVVSVLGASVAGLHSMTDEHFGISLVEYLAAGCIPIAHDSGTSLSSLVCCPLYLGPGPLQNGCCRNSFWVSQGALVVMTSVNGAMFALVSALIP